MNEERKQLALTLGMLGFEKTEAYEGILYVREKDGVSLEVNLTYPKIDIYVCNLVHVKYKESTTLSHIAKKIITRLLTLHAQCETDEEFFERVKERPKNPVPFKLD